MSCPKCLIFNKLSENLSLTWILNLARFNTAGSICRSGLGSSRSIFRVGLHIPGLQPDWASPPCWKGSHVPTMRPRLTALEVWKRLFGSPGQAYSTTKAQAVGRVSPVPGHSPFRACCGARGADRKKKCQICCFISPCLKANYFLLGDKMFLK